MINKDGSYDLNLISLTKEGKIDTYKIKAPSYSDMLAKCGIVLAQRIIHTNLADKGEEEVTHYDLQKKGIISEFELLYIGIGCSLQIIREEGYDEALKCAGYKKVSFFGEKEEYLTPLNSPDYISAILKEKENADNGRHKKQKQEQRNRHKKWCKDNPERRAKYKEENKDKIKATRLKYYKENKTAFLVRTHKRRVMMLESDDGTINTKALEELKTKQENKCYYCNEDLDYITPKAVHLDHFIPLSKGGAHSIDNVVWSCATCNLKKNAKMPATLFKI